MFWASSFLWPLSCCPLDATMAVTRNTQCHQMSLFNPDQPHLCKNNILVLQNHLCSHRQVHVQSCTMSLLNSKTLEPIHLWIKPVQPHITSQHGLSQMTRHTDQRHAFQFWLNSTCVIMTPQLLKVRQRKYYDFFESRGVVASPTRKEMGQTKN